MEIQTQAPVQPTYAPQGGMLNQPITTYLTAKNILIAGIIGFGIYYLIKQSKEKAYTKAMLEMSKNPISIKSQISSEQLRQIKENMHDCIAALNPNLSDDEIRQKVITVTSV